MSNPTSTPITLAHAIDEVMSAGSALHMDDARNMDWIPDDIGFLDEKFTWAKHSMEHIQAALHVLFELRSQEEIAKQHELMAAIQKNKN